LPNFTKLLEHPETNNVLFFAGRAARLMKRRSTSLPRPGKTDQSLPRAGTTDQSLAAEPRYATSGIPRPSMRSTKKHATQV